MSAVSKYFSKWIDVMYVRIARNFMVWPTDTANEKSMPSYFKRKFPSKYPLRDTITCLPEVPHIRTTRGKIQLNL